MSSTKNVTAPAEPLIEKKRKKVKASTHIGTDVNSVGPTVQAFKRKRAAKKPEAKKAQPALAGDDPLEKNVIDVSTLSEEQMEDLFYRTTVYQGLVQAVDEKIALISYDFMHGVNSDDSEVLISKLDGYRKALLKRAEEREKLNFKTPLKRNEIDRLYKMKVLDSKEAFFSETRKVLSGQSTIPSALRMVFKAGSTEAFTSIYAQLLQEAKDSLTETVQ